jgi:hypothetical protein
MSPWWLTTAGAICDNLAFNYVPIMRCFGARELWVVYAVQAITVVLRP